MTEHLGHILPRIRARPRHQADQPAIDALAASRIAEIGDHHAPWFQVTQPADRLEQPTRLGSAQTQHAHGPLSRRRGHSTNRIGLGHSASVIAARRRLVPYRDADSGTISRRRSSPSPSLRVDMPGVSRKVM